MVDYPALLGAAPVIVVWLVYDRKLNRAIDQEIVHAQQAQTGERIRLSEAFISRWSSLAVRWFALSFALGIVLAVAIAGVSLPQGPGLIVPLAVYLVSVLLMSLSAGAIVQRHLRHPWFRIPVPDQGLDISQTPSPSRRASV